MKLKQMLSGLLSALIMLGSVNLTAVSAAEGVADTPFSGGGVTIDISDDAELLPYAVNANNIKVGDYIILGSYNDEKILWRCVGKDNNGLLMLSDKILCFKAFDAKGGNLGGSHLPAYGITAFRTYAGSNFWGDSNIRDWLNSTAGAGEVVFTCGNPPKYDQVDGGNGYDKEAGFLSNFTESERAVMKPTTIKTIIFKSEYNNLGLDERTQSDGSMGLAEQFSWINECAHIDFDDFNTEDFTDTVFLPDLAQLYKIYSTAGLRSYYLAYPTEKAAQDFNKINSERIKATETQEYWTKTPATWYLDSRYKQKAMGSDGYIPAKAPMSNAGIRPMFYLDTNAEFDSGSGTVNSPYILADTAQVTETTTETTTAAPVVTIPTTTKTTTETTTLRTVETTTEATTVNINSNIYVSAPSSVSVGSEFSVTVGLRNAQTVIGGELGLRYDPSLLSVVSVSAGSAFTQNNISPQITEKYDSDKVFFTFANASDIDMNGELIKINFKSLAEGTASLDIPILSFSGISNNNIQELQLTASGARIAISDYPAGDVNGDRRVNYMDAVLILRYSAGLTELTSEQLARAEVAAPSNRVNYMDAVWILREAANLNN